MNEAIVIKHKCVNILLSMVLIAVFALMTHMLITVAFGQSSIFWTGLLVFTGYMLIPEIPPQIVMKLYRGQRLSIYDNPGIFQILEELSAKAGLNAIPALYYIPSFGMNAFSTGNNHSSAVAVSIGLVNNLNYQELKAVLAHEISHIANNDQRLMRFLQVGQKLISTIVVVLMVMCILAIPFILLGLVSISLPMFAAVAFAPLVAQLICMAFSRVREYEADLGAARLMNSPMPLISALRKLENNNKPWWKRLIFNSEKTLLLVDLLNSHPATEDRIRRLYETVIQPALQYRLPG